MTDSFNCPGNPSLFQMELISLWISERTILPPSALCLFSFSIATSTSNALRLGISGPAVCISVCLTSVNPMYYKQLRDVIPPNSQNVEGVCNHITLLILSSRLVTLLKVTDAAIQISDILVLTVCFKFINFSFQIFPLFSMKCLLVSCLTLFTLSSIVMVGSCNQCILACFL